MEEILIEEYNYPLPDERIAKYPLAQRDKSRLLVYRDGNVSEDVFCHIGDYLSSNSLLVYNNTRVIQARLVFYKAVMQLGDEIMGHEVSMTKGARIEIFCLEPLLPSDHQMALSSTVGCTWKCMIGNAKKWKTGALTLTTILPSGQMITLSAEKGEQTGNTFEVRFSWDGHPLSEDVSFAEILESVGELPIPPYLNRKTEDSDKTTYQTVYSRIKGSVAAPTAGLHFTDQVLDGLRSQGVQTAEVTLHVGAGTFQPVKVADANQHTMHTEMIAVTRDTMISLRDHVGEIVAVGTTSMRTLESLYFLGAQILSRLDENVFSHGELPTVAQFLPYTCQYQYSTYDALNALLWYLENSNEQVLHAQTQIMIKPGYKFRVVDKLITNFHQPKSTLLLLVSAFVGGDWHAIYDYALAHDFRFLSYGDSSILSHRV